METLLFLAHRLPYPPNKGDKIRSYHLLKHLARRYRVVLGAFIDDPHDWPHVEALRSLCAEVHAEAITPWRKRMLCGSAFLTGKALTLPYFYTPTMNHWVKDVVRRSRIERAFAYSSPMAQFLMDLPQVRSIVDFVDMDSAKWDDYARRRPWPVSALYHREARRLLAFERKVAAQFDATLFVTSEEAKLFALSASECAKRVVAIENGVDSEYFSPAEIFESPFKANERPIVFTGTMDYWPNVDAVVWFAREVLPQIRQKDASVRFHIVGMNPVNAVRALESDTAVSVAGRVADMRPYLQHAHAVVAPLRIARGIQNKVLEAMAMARPVVATSASAAALGARKGVEFEVADEASEFAAKVLSVMARPGDNNMGRLARARVLADYTWQSRFARLDELFMHGDPAHQIRSRAPLPARLAATSANAR